MTKRLVGAAVALLTLVSAPVSATIVSDTITGGIYAPVAAPPGAAGAEETTPLRQAAPATTNDYNAIASIPDVGIWALLVIGFGLVGTLARRRKPQVAA